MRYLVLDLHFSNGMFRFTAVALSYSELKNNLLFLRARTAGCFWKFQFSDGVVVCLRHFFVTSCFWQAVSKFATNGDKAQCVI